MVLPDLRALADQVGVKGASGMRKSELIAAIRETRQQRSRAETRRAPVTTARKRHSAAPTQTPRPRASAAAAANAAAASASASGPSAGQADAGRHGHREDPGRTPGSGHDRRTANKADAAESPSPSRASREQPRVGPRRQPAERRAATSRAAATQHGGNQQ